MKSVPSTTKQPPSAASVPLKKKFTPAQLARISDTCQRIQAHITNIIESDEWDANRFQDVNFFELLQLIEVASHERDMCRADINYPEVEFKHISILPLRKKQSDWMFAVVADRLNPGSEQPLSQVDINDVLKFDSDQSNTEGARVISSLVPQGRGATEFPQTLSKYADLIDIHITGNIPSNHETVL